MSERIGNFITKNPPTPTLSAAPGIWTLDQAMQARKTNTWPWAPLPTATPYAVDLDGTNDYFSRASDLTGNADGKTFTFSAWITPWSSGSTYYLYSSDLGYFSILATASNPGTLELTAKNSAGTTILYIQVSSQILYYATNFHLLISVDLANTSNRYVYINDIQVSPTWVTYTNDNIDFTRATHYIGQKYDGTGKFGGRLGNLFLDYTYRDLSNVTNRRLFITADRKPAAGQAALNPIIYCPFDDPADWGKNLGTGGAFTPNGVMARSGRGANQYNVAYSDLDGAADYLSRTSLTGVADSKTFTISFCINWDGGSSYPFGFHDVGNTKQSIYLNINGTTGAALLYGKNSANTTILLISFAAGSFVVGRNYLVQVSLDMSDTNKRHAYVNGQVASITWTTYTNDTIAFSSNGGVYEVGAMNGAYHNGRLGSVFFHTSYIDLSVPANLAKFVTGTGIDAKPVDLGANAELPFGTPPIFCLPMYGNDAGRDISGNGNHFTVNSGPYTGARGPNEFFGNKWDFNGTTSYAYRTSALTGVSDGKTFSCSFWFTSDNLTGDHLIAAIRTTANDDRLSISTSGTSLYILASNSSNAQILSANVASMSTATSYYVQLYIDLSNTSNRGVIINGTPAAVTWTTYTNDTIPFSQPRIGIGANAGGGAMYDGKLSEFYFTTEYIDFSQEANRLKFRDAFGNPCDLIPQITAGSIPNPAIYMRFAPDAPAANNGTGGAFTAVDYVDGGQL